MNSKIKKPIISAPEEPERTKRTYLFPDGSKYAGEVKIEDGKSMRDGIGEFTTPFERYVGWWKNDMMEGQGKLFFSSGAKYEGFFMNNMMHGVGTYRWPIREIQTPHKSVEAPVIGAAVYEGNWANNKMNGNGCFTDENGVKFHGLFHNGTFTNSLSKAVLNR
mmetsp:Transcript_5651/g.7988  ORF Transcript_5651/g.7988 Transcript_5651/m.7988 type:complete len:163 (-) Transcript_5651:45-533(-)